MRRIEIVLIVFFISCVNQNGVKRNELVTAVPILPYQIINIHPHDTSSYTQGLIVLNNKLYESTGLWEKSKLAEVDIKTGKPIKILKIEDPKIFGEGITILNNKIYQLTWKNNKVFVYDASTFKKINEFTWHQEGWGITHSHDTLIISTGSSNLYLVNPIDFKIISVIPVTRNSISVPYLNELEYINGYVYANEYETDNILKINLKSGIVEGVLDMSNLLEKSGMQYNIEKYVNASGNVLNGIAYDSINNTILVTGKLWPALFDIKLN
jgi:glutamine cyclotransferase